MDGDVVTALMMTAQEYSNPSMLDVSQIGCKIIVLLYCTVRKILKIKSMSSRPNVVFFTC